MVYMGVKVMACDGMYNDGVKSDQRWIGVGRKLDQC
jgi:hypothetical protein